MATQVGSGVASPQSLVGNDPLGQLFSTWGTCTRGDTSDFFSREYAEELLNLRLYATVKPLCHFVWSSKDKICFSNVIKFTESTLFSSKHL